jgi:hypothetical protein
MKNYAKGQPVGNNQVPFFESPPPVLAETTTMRENAVASSILILSSVTTAIEIMAVGAPAYLKWLSRTVVDSSVAGTSVISAAGTANFDAMVAKDTIRRFVVPIASTTATPGSYGAPQGANRDNNLYSNVAIKSATIASVVAIEN